MTVDHNAPLASANTPGDHKSTDNMKNQTSEDPQRRAAIDEHLSNRKESVLESETEKRDFLDSILLLKSGTRTLATGEHVNTDHHTGTLEHSTTSLARPVHLPDSKAKQQQKEKHESPTDRVTSSDGENLSLTVKRTDKDMTWETSSSSSVLSSPPEVILTPDDWVVSSSSGNSHINDPPSPTRQRLEKLSGFNDVNDRLFNALVAVAGVAQQESDDPKARMTMEKLEAAGVIFESGKSESGKSGSGKPGSGKPGSGKSGSGKPGSSKPGSGKSGSGKPGSGKPGSGKSGSGKPGSGKPGSGKPGSGKSGSTLDKQESEPKRSL